MSGFHLNEHLYNMIIRRYSDEEGNMDFDNFISCLVRLDAMFRKWHHRLSSWVGILFVHPPLAKIFEPNPEVGSGRSTVMMETAKILPSCHSVQ